MPSAMGHALHHQHLHLHARAAGALADAVVAPLPATADIAREPSPAEVVPRAAATGCSNDGGGCETTSGNSETIPITVAIVVPVVIAFGIFIYLHRRHVRKLRAEDARDTHRSLDFGLDAGTSGKNKKRKRGGKKQQPMVEVTEIEKSLRHPKGLSLDMDLGNPYMLPPEIHQSHESLHSLSRTLGNSGHDPYRPSTLAEAPRSIRGPLRDNDGASTRTGGTGSTGAGFRQDGMNRNLLRNASRVSQSIPPESSSVIELPHPDGSPAASSPFPRNALPTGPAASQGFLAPAELDADPRKSTASHDVTLRHSNNYLANFIHSREASVAIESPRASVHARSPVASPPPDRIASPPIRPSSPPVRSPSPPTRALPTHQPLPQISIEQQEFSGAAALEWNEIVVPPPEDAACRTPRAPTHAAMAHDVDDESPEDYYDPEEDEGRYDPGHLGIDGYAQNRLSIMRPLPPDDPNDTAEQRANRIRSFYKEYFHEHEAHAYAPQAADYYEDYGSEYLADPTLFDPSTNQFIVAQAPYAAPVTRRAMTPPPRGPPRQFPGGPGPYGPGSAAGSFVSGPRGRAFSTVSGGMGPRGRGPAARPPPPPKALTNLPTPHLLKDDNIAIFGAMDFAPPPRYKDQAIGRPASPHLEQRPYSPSVRVASPLVSAYHELPAMPSPHLLRQSSTFTALDFAPPPRFKDRDGGGSDAGSIRSGRSARTNGSAMSSAQLQHLRAGAFRLSRVPTDLVGSRTDFANSLRPTWHVGSSEARASGF